MITGARLVDLDGTELLVFADPLRLQGLTLGYPDARSASSPLPGRSGERDTTRYHGGSAVTLELAVQEGGAVGRDVWIDRVRGYLRPGQRAWLHVSSSDWPAERRILVRGDQVPVPFAAPGAQKISVGLRAPYGVLESATPHTQTLFPSSSGGEGGIVFPLTWPDSFDPGNVPGAALLANNGTTDAWLSVDIYGLCTNPVLKNLTTGRQIGFSGLTVQAGEFLRLDMREMTALLSNVASQSRYGLLDFTTSTWWPLGPGTSQVAFVASNPGVTCQAQLTWRDTTI